MAIPFLSNIDLNKNQLLNHTLHNATANPSSPSEGQIYYNTSTEKVLVYNATAQDWISIAGDITAVTSATTNQLTVANENGPAPAFSIVTGAVANGSTALATGDQIYDFVIGQNYSTTTGTVTSVAIAGTDGIDVDSGSPITSSGTITLGLSNVPNTSLANSSITIGDSTIALGGTDTTLTGLTDIDLTAANHTIFDNVGENTLTIGAATTTVTIPGNLQVTGETTFINETILVAEDNTIAFEGTTSGDDLFIKLTSAEPTTASKTITLPDLSGHVALLSAAATETITATPAELNLLDGITILSGSNTGDEPDASTTVKGIVELATSDETKTGTDTARAVTPDGLAARTVVATIDVSNATLTGQTAPYKATIEHALGTKDLIVQLQDVTTFEVIHADISTTAFDGSESTTKITIGFDNALPSNDVRVIITSGAGATSITPAYA